MNNDMALLVILSPIIVAVVGVTIVLLLDVDGKMKTYCDWMKRK